jgi:hypothetical protein
MDEGSELRKSLEMRGIVERLPNIAKIDFWRKLNPDATITTDPVACSVKAPLDPLHLLRSSEQLREEGYFQTQRLLPMEEIVLMRACIEAVKAEGLPVMFALVYDVFYRAFGWFEPVLGSILGPAYRIIPNFWVYYVETSDHSKGFEPHRDAEYAGTIGPDGLPSVLTVWVPITDATPLGSCMYVVPASRDPQYAQSLRDPRTGATQFALEDIRAIPAEAGTLNCWNQHIYHWGSRSSRRALVPRISYALYCQRGDIPPVDGVAIDFRGGIDFPTRLGLICRSLARYSTLSVEDTTGLEPLLDFLGEHIGKLATDA